MLNLIHNLSRQSFWLLWWDFTFFSYTCRITRVVVFVALTTIILYSEFKQSFTLTLQKKIENLVFLPNFLEKQLNRALVGHIFKKCIVLGVNPRDSTKTQDTQRHRAWRYRCKTLVINSVGS